jgi:hypothetical protein
VTGPRDDRVFPETRALAVFIVVFLIPAFGLYLLPGRTGWFAWPVKPPMTPLVMGSGYIAAAYFFARVAVARSWHRVQLGFLPTATFSTFMLIATAVHWDRFEHGKLTFWTWTALYVLTPILVPLAWLRNRRTDPGMTQPGDVQVPRHIRTVLMVTGAGLFIVAVILLVSPSTMIDIWGWTLTPLTSRVLAGWFALPGLVAFLMGVDGRWSAIRITLESQLIGLALILLGAMRAWEDFDTSKAATYVFVGGLGLLLLGLVGFAMYMSGLQRRSAVELPSVRRGVQQQTL